MESSEGAAPGGSRRHQLTLAGLPDNALDILAAQLDAQSRLSLSHACRSLRQAGQRWFPRVRVALGPELDSARLASWLRSHEGAEARLVLAEDSDATLLDTLTTTELRGLAVCELDVNPGPAMDATQLRSLAQLTSLVVMGRSLAGDTDSLAQLVALQQLDFWHCLPGIPPALAALTGLARLALAGVDLSSVGSQDRILQQLVGLRELELQECRLAAVPQAVTALTALTYLDLGWNRLGQPEGLTLLAALTQLRALDLGGNDCDIPEGLSTLTGLMELVLIETRPSHASLNRVLPRLVGLQHLDLTGCGLATVPTAITALTALTCVDLYFNLWGGADALAPVAALTQLRELNLGNSKWDLPSSLSALTALTALNLDRPNGYPLCSLPPVVSALTRLEVLFLRQAILSTGWWHLRLLTRLRELNLCGSYLWEIPQELTALLALEELVH